jgi:hypothetical protein
MGGVLVLRRRGGTVHGLSFVVLVLLQVERVGSCRCFGPATYYGEYPK